MDLSLVEQLVISLLVLIGAYAALGVVAAVYFHARVLSLFDSSTRDSGVLFRVLITPGLVALWPVILFTLRGEGSGRVRERFAPRRLRALQGLLIIVAAIVLPLAVGAALYTRPAVSEISTTNELTEQ